MKKKSRWSAVSCVFGCIGLWLAWTGAGGLRILALPAGIFAALGGIGALWSLRDAGRSAHGRGIAISAICMGTMSAGIGAATLLGILFQQFSPGFGQRWDPSQHAAEVEGNNRMSDRPAGTFTSNLPLVVLDTAGRGVTKNRPTLVRARFYDSQTGRVSLDSTPVYDGYATINLRGYSTLQLPKHSYTLHTVDSNSNQINVPLLGLPAEEDWVLYAPYEDKSLIRDVLAYELANRMGRYAPRTRFVELFIRDSNRQLSMRDYVGVYVLVEKIKRSKERVNIAKLGPEDNSEPAITGGYIVKRDHSERPDTRFRTRNGGPYTYVYPKGSRITEPQKRWLRQYFNSFETALHGPNFADPETGYAAFLDVDSFIDAFWLIEMSKNVDGFRYSSFITKDRGGKLKTEPPWDWNRSFGNANYYGGGTPRGWYWTNLRPNEISWYKRLREDPEFAQRCAARWVELRRSVFDPVRINRRVDELAAQLQEAQQRNFRRWSILGRQVTCNHYVGDSYEEEVKWLKKWIERRIGWIDSQVRASSN